jgi:cytochrome d ubiquinol oxidase subunit II
MIVDLAFVWAGIIAFAVFMYVVLDGFDLGVGILFPFALEGEERDTAMNSIAPVWDGNETWLVMGGGGLFAVFPLAYATVLPALYMPLTVMLLALVFRGVAFEYRGRTTRWKQVWNVGFAAGSLIAALMQGIALGALVQGIDIQDRAYAGGWWDWLTPFSVMVGVAVATGYALLGATWLVMKTSGDLQARMRAFAWYLGAATLAFVGLVSLFTPLQNTAYVERWFGWPQMAYTMLVPVLVLASAALLFGGLKRGYERTPFLASLALFALSYAGIAISFYPYIVPPTLTIWDAAAPNSSLAFTLVGAAVLLPAILAYTGYAYWVFRGKVGASGGYH